MSAVLDSTKYDNLLSNVTKLNNILSKVDSLSTQVAGLQTTRDLRLDADICRLLAGETKMVTATDSNREKAHKLQDLSARLASAANQYRGAVYANLSTLAKAKEGDERSISRVNRTCIDWLVNGAEDTLADLQQVWNDIQSADGN